MSILSISLCYLLLLNLRTSTIKNVYNYICVKYGIGTMKQARRITTLRRKIVKTQLDEDYLVTCKTYTLFPKFLRFRLYKRSLENSAFYRSWQSKLLTKEISSKRESYKRLNLQLGSVREEIRRAVSFLDFLVIDRLIKYSISKFHTKTSATHLKKLRTLGIERKPGPCDPSKVIFNFSSVTLSRRIKTILAFGLDFCLPVFKIDFYSHFLSFEKLAHSLKEFRNDQCTQSVVNELRNLSNKYFFNFKPYKIFCNVIKKHDLSILKHLSSNKNVIVCKPDKGAGVVLLNRLDYITSMTKIVSDNSKFLKINITIEKYCRSIDDKVNNFLRKIKNSISLETYKNLYVSGSAPGILYGLPKIHKIDFSAKFQMRPIFASYNTATYKLSKFLVPLLNSLTENEFTLKNSYSFSEEISKFLDANNYVMASFDIENLFTNIPLDETI